MKWIVAIWIACGLFTWGWCMEPGSKFQEMAVESDANFVQGIVITTALWPAFLSAKMQRGQDL